MALSADGQWLARAGWGAVVHLQNLRTGQKRELKRLGGSLHVLAFSPDGRWLAAPEDWEAEGETREGVGLWEVATGVKRGQYVAGKEIILCLAFSGDGRMLAAGSADRQLWLWESASLQQRVSFPEQYGSVSAVCFSPDGRQLASGGWDTAVHVWNLTSNEADGKKSTEKLTDEQLDACWRNLASTTDAAGAYRTMLRLLNHPLQAVALLANRLPRVADQDAQIARFIRDLDDESFEVREQAMQALEKHGQQAEADLRRALEKPVSLEAERRLEKLVGKLGKAKSVPEPLLLLRSVELLERMSSPEARRLLTKLAQGPPDSRLTKEVKAALSRLGMASQKPFQE